MPAVSLAPPCRQSSVQDGSCPDLPMFRNHDDSCRWRGPPRHPWVLCIHRLWHHDRPCGGETLGLQINRWWTALCTLDISRMLLFACCLFICFGGFFVCLFFCVFGGVGVGVVRNWKTVHGSPVNARYAEYFVSSKSGQCQCSLFVVDASYEIV